MCSLGLGGAIFSLWHLFSSTLNFLGLVIFQNEATTAKVFVKLMETAENDYQVCKNVKWIFWVKYADYRLVAAELSYHISLWLSMCVGRRFMTTQLGGVKLHWGFLLIILLIYLLKFLSWDIQLPKMRLMWAHVWLLSGSLWKTSITGFSSGCQVFRLRWIESHTEGIWILIHSNKLYLSDFPKLAGNPVILNY